MPTRSAITATFLDPGQGMRLEARTESGFPLGFDTTAASDGGAGPSPTEAVLAALAACTAMDVASILRKKRQPFDRYTISVIGEKADEHPQVFTAIVVEHHLFGSMTAEAVRRSVELSATAYCPVSAMLSSSVRIEHRYRIVRPNAAADEEALVVVTGPDGGRAADRAATA
jgi:putative redox protein